MKKCILNLDERNSVKFVKELETIKIGNKEECKIILPNNITCTPFGMLLTSSAIKKFREKNKDNKFNFEMDRKGEGVRYAGHMGFFKNISEDIEYGNLPGEALGSNNYIPITKVDFKNYSKKFIYSKMLPVTYIEFESKRLAKVLARENNELLKLFTYLIREIIRNSQEHGQVEQATICAQYWKSNNLAEIAILDEGIGYKNSLIKKYGNEIKGDEDAIRYALKPGVTEAIINNYSQEDENSGFGVYVASEICNELNGSFSIISGDTIIKKCNGSIITSKGYHKGSGIKMVIDTSKKFECKNLISQIVNKGENEIKLKGLGYGASELSKGKFLLY